MSPSLRSRFRLLALPKVNPSCSGASIHAGDSFPSWVEGQDNPKTERAQDQEGHGALIRVLLLFPGSADILPASTLVLKEGLVDQVKPWPGVRFAKSILGGKPLKGLWFNRTQEFAAKNRGEDFGRLKYAEEEELELSQLPCWADLTPDQYRDRIAELVEEIEVEARADREARGVEPLGVEAILRQDPQARPNQTKKSPAPAYHAATKAARKSFWESYSAFVAAFREAADKLKAGDRTARFPLGSFPPALPFVSAYPSLPP